MMWRNQAARRFAYLVALILLVVVLKQIGRKDLSNSDINPTITLFVHKDFRGPEPRLTTRQSKRPFSLFCLVLTTRSTVLKLKAVKATWAKRCNKTVFFSDGPDNFEDIVYLDSIQNGRQHLTEKVLKAFEYVQTNYANYDWYLKADDDTYIIVENLRVLLSYFSSKDPVYLGQNFKYFTKQGYNSGGAGYVISKSALHKLLFGVKFGTCKKDGNDEDVDIGTCLDSQGVVAYDTTDRLKRETFHGGTMEEHIVGPISSLLLDYPSMKAQIGPECCSTLTISFHHVPPSSMYIVDMLLYHVTVYGRNFNTSGKTFD